MYILANMRVMSNSGELLGYLDISNENGYLSRLLYIWYDVIHNYPSQIKKRA